MKVTRERPLDYPTMIGRGGRVVYAPKHLWLLFVWLDVRHGDGCWSGASFHTRKADAVKRARLSNNFFRVVKVPCPLFVMPWGSPPARAYRTRLKEYDAQTAKADTKKTARAK